MTHKECLAHFRAELERQGVRVIGVRYNARTTSYGAFSTNFVRGGHIFRWRAGTPRVEIFRCDAGGKDEKYVAQMFIAQRG